MTFDYAIRFNSPVARAIEDCFPFLEQTRPQRDQRVPLKLLRARHGVVPQHAGGADPASGLAQQRGFVSPVPWVDHRSRKCLLIEVRGAGRDGQPLERDLILDPSRGVSRVVGEPERLPGGLDRVLILHGESIMDQLLPYMDIIPKIELEGTSTRAASLAWVCSRLWLTVR